MDVVVSLCRMMKSLAEMVSSGLWKNEAWSNAFFEFIQTLIGDGASPDVIEIHHHFDDYCSPIDHFLDTYEFFERSVLEENTQALLSVLRTDLALDTAVENF
jgi:hypothetical protein